LNVRHIDKKCKKKSGDVELRFLLFVLIIVDRMEEFLNNNINSVNGCIDSIALFKTARIQRY